MIFDILTIICSIMNLIWLIDMQADVLKATLATDAVIGTMVTLPFLQDQ